MNDRRRASTQGKPMDCEQARAYWHLFHDSEGDAELHWQVNEHLQDCPACSRWFTRQTALEESIVHTLRGGDEATPQLWARLERRLQPPAVTRSRRWMLFGSIGLAIAATLLVAIGVATWGRPAGDLAAISVATHERLTRGGEVPGFVSDSHLDIERYLKRHVSFPVRCPPRDDAGFAARAAGTTRISANPAAYVIGQVDGTDVSLLILSRDSLKRFPGERSRMRRSGAHHSWHGGVEVVMTEFDQNLVMAVGRAPPDRLRKLLRAYGSYAHGHPAS